jgi:hypothetical protein
MSIGHHIMRGSPRFRRPPNLFIFGISFLGLHWAFSQCHVASHDWATWQPTIGPHQPTVYSSSTSTYILPPQKHISLLWQSMVYHVTIWIAM